MSMGRNNKSRKPTVALKSKLKKDPGVPRLPDLRLRKADKQRLTNVPPARTDPDSIMASEPTLSTLALLAESSQAASSSYAGGEDDDFGATSINGKTKEQLRKHYLRTLHKVIDQSDIVVLVLDARDPEGCRSRLVEEEVRRRESEGKTLVFVLNKIDLIPRANAQLWLKHLRHSTPTLPFLSSASAQHQRSNITSSTAPALMKLLKAYKPKTGTVTVGVVGFPNVGKSSLINSLKRSKVCAVAAQAGHTKDLQSIQLERGMRIVDSPGVVFDEDDEDPTGKGQKKGSVLLRNVVKVEDILDPIEVVEEILLRTAPETIRKIYNLPEFTNTIEFLTMLALSSGRLLKGGTPDLIAAARHVLNDWNHQKIPYFSVPPLIHPSSMPSIVQQTSTIAPGAENVGQAQILTELSKPFELDGLFGAADAGAFGGRKGSGAQDDSEMMITDDDDGEVFWDAVEEHMEEDHEDDGMGPDDDLAHVVPRKRSRSLSVAPSMTTAEAREPEGQYARQPKRQRRAKDVPEYDAPPDAHALKRMGQSNPLNRRALKKDAKKSRRAAGRAEKARLEALGGGMEVDGDEDGLQFTFMA